MPSKQADRMISRYRIRRSPLAAFTLVELVVVLLIIAIVAATAAPRYQSAIAYHQLSGATRQLQADLQFVRDEALRTSRTQRVVFDAATNGYSLTGIVDPQRPARNYAINLAAAPYGVDLVQATFAGHSYLDFNLHGLPSGTGQAQLKLGTLRMAVVVDEAGHTTVSNW